MIAAGVIVAVAGTALAFAGLGMSGHMAGHMLAVAVAAPLIALGLFPSTSPAKAGAQFGDAGEYARHSVTAAFPTGPRPSPGYSRWVGLPLAMMVAELLLIWGWHLPALRDAADMHTGIALIEQASFLAIGIALWRASLAAPAAGIAALLLTSMHMTLLGALIGLAPRPLYAMMAMHPAPGLDALADQQLGGAIMLAIGGVSYLAGGLWLLGRVLRGETTA